MRLFSKKHCSGFAIETHFFGHEWHCQGSAACSPKTLFGSVSPNGEMAFFNKKGSTSPFSTSTVLDTLLHKHCSGYAIETHFFSHELHSFLQSRIALSGVHSLFSTNTVQVLPLRLFSTSTVQVLPLRLISSVTNRTVRGPQPLLHKHFSGFAIETLLQKHCSGFAIETHFFGHEWHCQRSAASSPQTLFGSVSPNGELVFFNKKGSTAPFPQTLFLILFSTNTVQVLPLRLISSVTNCTVRGPQPLLHKHCS